jgi:hypothetical protein
MLLFFISAAFAGYVDLSGQMLSVTQVPNDGLGIANGDLTDYAGSKAAMFTADDTPIGSGQAYVDITLSFSGNTSNVWVLYFHSSIVDQITFYDPTYNHYYYCCDPTFQNYLQCDIGQPVVLAPNNPLGSPTNGSLFQVYLASNTMNSSGQQVFHYRNQITGQTGVDTVTVLIVVTLVRAGVYYVLMFDCDFNTQVTLSNTTIL